MDSASCSAHVLPYTATLKPRTYGANSSNYKAYLINKVQKTSMQKLHSIRVQAAANNGNTKPKSIICADCDGNGAVLCSQCKGSGVNPVDFFGGQFKTGDSCWLCGGKRICYVGIAMALASLVVL